MYRGTRWIAGPKNPVGPLCGYQACEGINFAGSRCYEERDGRTDKHGPRPEAFVANAAGAEK